MDVPTDVSTSFDVEKIRASLARVYEAEVGRVTDRQRSRAHAQLGRLYLRERLLSEAREAFERAEQKNPQDVTMLVGRGNLALLAGDVSGAASLFAKARSEAIA